MKWAIEHVKRGEIMVVKCELTENKDKFLVKRRT